MCENILHPTTPALSHTKNMVSKWGVLYVVLHSHLPYVHVSVILNFWLHLSIVGQSNGHFYSNSLHWVWSTWPPTHPTSTTGGITPKALRNWSMFAGESIFVMPSIPLLCDACSPHCGICRRSSTWKTPTKFGTELVKVVMLPTPHPCWTYPTTMMYPNPHALPHPNPRVD